jgi:hypothetical protein
MGDWVEAFDERSGMPYYYNTETRESSWTKYALGASQSALRPFSVNGLHPAASSKAEITVLRIVQAAPMLHDVCRGIRPSSARSILTWDLASDPRPRLAALHTAASFDAGSVQPGISDRPYGSDLEDAHFSGHTVWNHMLRGVMH